MHTTTRTRTLKNRPDKGFSLRQMSDSTYALRRRVLDVIYAAKARGFDLPRVEVRIVDAEGETATCGYAYLGQRIVHIVAEWASAHEAVLTHLVLHEVVHAVTGAGHDESCYLMASRLPLVIDAERSWSAFARCLAR